MLRTSVLIVGGGPAGATAAKYLARSGVATLLVERDIAYTKPCGGGIPSTAFDELGIPSHVVTTQVQLLRIVSPRGATVEMTLKGGYICIAERGLLDRALREQAQQEGAQSIEGEFVRFEKVDTKAGAPVRALIRKRGEAEETTVTADYVIAADGISSRVAAALGLPAQEALHTISARALPQNGSVCEFWFGKAHAEHFYSWVFPAGAGVSVGTGGSAPRGLTALLSAFVERRYGSSLPSLRERGIIEKTRAFKIPLWRGTLFNAGNILFVGDAAGVVMPVTYEGIYYAMKSGEFAARALCARKPADYKKLWRARFRTRFLFMNAVRSHLFKSDATVEKWIALHEKPEVQELAMNLWLRKHKGEGSLLSYMKVFRHLLKL